MIQDPRVERLVWNVREHCTVNTPRDVPSVMGEGTSLFPSGSDVADAHVQLPATTYHILIQYSSLFVQTKAFIIA